MIWHSKTQLSVFCEDANCFHVPTFIFLPNEAEKLTRTCNIKGVIMFRFMFIVMFNIQKSLLHVTLKVQPCSYLWIYNYIVLVRLWNNAWICSWNQPVLRNKGNQMYTKCQLFSSLTRIKLCFVSRSLHIL